jgi:predicted DNA-binding protein YlxM (UPF0122 family)
VEELLANLDGPQFTVIKLEFIDGWPLEEIARHLNKSVEAIYTIKSRAIEKLRKFAKKNGLLEKATNTVYYDEERNGDEQRRRAQEDSEEGLPANNGIGKG